MQVRISIQGLQWRFVHKFIVNDRSAAIIMESTIKKRGIKRYLNLYEFFRDVAQPGSAHVWGVWGRKFESCHPDKVDFFQNRKLVNSVFTGFFDF